MSILVKTNFLAPEAYATPTIGTNVNVTNNSYGQDEPNIAINPLHCNFQSNDLHVAVGANDYRSGTGFSQPGLYTSTDLTTWSFHSVLTPSGYQSYGNPVLAYDSLGNLYYAYMAWHVDSNGFKHDGTIYVSKSTDEGQTWTFYTRVSSLGSGDNPYNDRPWLCIDRSNNYIYVSWTVWHGLTQGTYTTSGSDIMFAVSKDSCQSFSMPKVISSSYLPSNQQRQWSKIAISSSGEVYVTWRRLATGGLTKAVFMAKSVNYGTDFGSETLVIQYPDFSAYDFSDITGVASCTWPQLTVGQGSNLYLVWHGYVSNGNRDVYFMKSTNGGSSWSTKLTISSMSDQFWPEIAVASDGRIDIVWYDCRDDSDNRLVNLYYISSHDSGQTFDLIAKVTPYSSDPTLPATGSKAYFGDCISLAETSDGIPLPVWTDTRNGNQEIYISTGISSSQSVDRYIVAESGTNMLSTVTTTGTRTQIYENPGGTPTVDGVAIDNSGNYIVIQCNPQLPDPLSKITLTGVKTDIYTFPTGAGPTSLAIDSAGNYIVTEWESNKVSKITPAGTRTEIYVFAPLTGPAGIAIDNSGNYIIAEHYTGKLSKVTPSGVRTEIYTFATNTGPQGVAIDSSGNYIVAESAMGKLSKITPSGVRTEIYTFAAGAYPAGIAIDSAGNYIVTEHLANTLSKVTPNGIRTPICYFSSNTGPQGVAILQGNASTGYSATVWAWDVQGWIAEPITMDGVATGYNTPHTFSNLIGSHTFTVPAIDVLGYPFDRWSTGQTSRTITVTSTGTFTAEYRPKTTEIIIDNTQATFVGTWPTSTYYSGYYGSNYQYNSAGTGTHTAAWNFNIASAGQYQVYAWWTSAPNRASNAKYTVNYAGGSIIKQVNQQVNGGSWQSLGTYTFNVGSYSVVLSDLANAEVNADAIRLVPVTTPTEIIVDNPQATFVGTWPTSTYYPGYYGTNYQYNTAGTGTHTCTWSFSISTAGSYQVYARWTSASNRPTNAKYTINTASGSATVTVNQQINGGSWQSLGTYSFNVGSYSVMLSDLANGEVNADAIRIIPATIPTEIIVDNTAGVFVGSWPTSTYYPGYYGNNYQWNSAGSGADTATWSFNIPSAGSYQVFARWTSATNRATNAPYTINYAGGSTTVPINQQINGGTWQSLGTFNFNAGSYNVRLSDLANGEVNADAIRIIRVG